MNLTYVTTELGDIEGADNMAGFEAAGACATCGRETPTTRTAEAAGWVAAFCLDEPDKAIALIADRYPLYCMYCPDCAPEGGQLDTNA